MANTNSFGLVSRLEMDPMNAVTMYKHLEKQSEVLMESYRAMSHDLHALQVEEEMLMKKLYEIMCAEGLVGKEKKTEGDANEEDVPSPQEHPTP